MSYPEITTGLGKLTPDLFGRIVKMLRSFESNEGVSRDNRPSDRIYSDYFMAKLTGCSAVSGTIRWEYSFTEVYSDGSTYAIPSNAQTGTVAAGTAAYNLCEMGNSGDLVGTGVDMGGTDYPAGFNMMPIGMTADNFDPATGAYASLDVNVVVMMYNVNTATDTMARVFFAGNSHDGVCTV
jgi:hypothetical protein